MGSISAEERTRQKRMSGKKRGRPGGRLEGGLVDVRIRAVDRLDLAGEGIGDSGCYSHGAGCG